MGKNIGKNISSSGKYNQKLLDHVKQFAADAVKTSLKRVIHKTAKATGNWIGNKVANNITRVSKSLQQNHSDTVINEHEK